ncbi:MAG TPA: hypothetical protein VME70_09905 [Mycobacteriales bacterium]|nr:hypothetical protein [Mycobacteriales bacterium]
MRWRKGDQSASTIAEEAAADLADSDGQDPTVGEPAAAERRCARCERMISGRQEARRTATGDWVHLAC